MAFSSGFFNSLNGDRRYDSKQVSELIGLLLTDGVFANVLGLFATIPGEGMQVLVNPGRCWFNNTWSYNDSLFPLRVEAADVLLPRFDAVIIEVNEDITTRDNKLKVLKGVPGVVPIKPKMTNTETLHQHPIAYLRIEPGSTSIPANKIENIVGTKECPFVTGILEGADIEDLFQQWQYDFDIWFENLKQQLTEDVVANLQKQIDERVKIVNKATKEEAIAGASDEKWMTPVGVKNAISSLSGFVYDVSNKKNFKIRTGGAYPRILNYYINLSGQSPNYLMQGLTKNFFVSMFGNWQSSMLITGVINIFDKRTCQYQQIEIPIPTELIGQTIRYMVSSWGYDTIYLSTDAYFVLSVDLETLESKVLNTVETKVNIPINEFGSDKDPISNEQFALVSIGWSGTQAAINYIMLPTLKQVTINGPSSCATAVNVYYGSIAAGHFICPHMKSPPGSFGIVDYDLKGQGYKIVHAPAGVHAPTPRICYAGNKTWYLLYADAVGVDPTFSEYTLEHGEKIIGTVKGAADFISSGVRLDIGCDALNVYDRARGQIIFPNSRGDVLILGVDGVPKAFLNFQKKTNGLTVSSEIFDNYMLLHGSVEIIKLYLDPPYKIEVIVIPPGHNDLAAKPQQLIRSWAAKSSRGLVGVPSMVTSYVHSFVEIRPDEYIIEGAVPDVLL